MQGNKKAKNNTKKSWYFKNRSGYWCDCYLCEGNWKARYLEKTRARKKDIKNKRHSVTMVGFDL